MTSSVVFKVLTTVSSLYVNSYSFEWEEMLEAPLQSLSMNKPNATIIEGESEQLAVSLNPKSATTGIIWHSENEDIATVDADGLVTAKNIIGSTTVIATSTVDGSITTQSVINVIKSDYSFYPKVTNSSLLHFGATYIIGTTNGQKAMTANVASGLNSIPALVSVTNANGDIRYNNLGDSILRVSLEVGIVEGTYALKTITDIPSTNGKYLYSAGGSSTADYYLKLGNTLTEDGSWLITYDGTSVSLVSKGNAVNNVMRFSPGKNVFTSYDTGQQDVALYIDEQSIDPLVSASIVANEINSGIGNNAASKCLVVLPILEGAYNLLSYEAKSIFDTSTQYSFISARERMAYLNLWASSQANGSGKFNSVTKDGSSAITVILIGIVGFTTIAAYYFLKRKKVKID